LKFGVLSGLRPVAEAFPLERVAEAYECMIGGKARFRVVLTSGQQ
jgi:D-arabinose 1-dehydrogenase-like Zn-dependent alcohol dehydrogenase